MLGPNTQKPLNESEIIDLVEQPCDLNTSNIEFDDDPEADIQATIKQNSEDDDSRATLQHRAKSQTPRDPTQCWRHKVDFPPDFTATSLSLPDEEDVQWTTLLNI